MTKKQLIPVLLIGVGLLLLSNLIVWFWFAKDMHLEWDAPNFNNVVTPIATVIALAVYGYALLQTIEQNKIILSQSFKPHVEREFDRLTKQFIEEQTNFKTGDNFNDRDLMGTLKIYVQIIENNKEYRQDISDWKDGILHTQDELESRTYYKRLLFFEGMTVVDYSSIFQLIDYIDNSDQLLESDRNDYKRRIVVEFVGKYLTLIEHLTKNPFYIPDYFWVFGGEKVEFISY